jgi:excisionase family DNA binding protein
MSSVRLFLNPDNQKTEASMSNKRNAEWLTPLQFAKAVQLSRSTIYERINEGDIPEQMLLYAGPRKILIHAKALDHFKALWTLRRAYGLEVQTPQDFS